MSNETNMCGDAAKLREVLKRAWLFVSATRESFAFVHEGRIERDKLCEDIDAALSAPPRNCDRPECATLDMATKTWIQEEFAPLCNNSKATMADIRTFDVWIYAPATEKEGGAK